MSDNFIGRGGVGKVVSGDIIGRGRVGKAKVLSGDIVGRGRVERYKGITM